MKYVYIVIDRKAGVIFGAFASRSRAHQVMRELFEEGAGKELWISQEPIIDQI